MIQSLKNIFTNKTKQPKLISPQILINLISEMAKQISFSNTSILFYGLLHQNMSQKTFKINLSVNDLIKFLKKKSLYTRFDNAIEIYEIIKNSFSKGLMLQLTQIWSFEFFSFLKKLNNDKSPVQQNLLRKQLFLLAQYYSKICFLIFIEFKIFTQKEEDKQNLINYCTHLISQSKTFKFVFCEFIQNQKINHQNKLTKQQKILIRVSFNNYIHQKLKIKGNYENILITVINQINLFQTAYLVSEKLSLLTNLADLLNQSIKEYQESLNGKFMTWKQQPITFEILSYIFLLHLPHIGYHLQFISQILFCSKELIQTKSSEFLLNYTKFSELIQLYCLQYTNIEVQKCNNALIVIINAIHAMDVLRKYQIPKTRKKMFKQDICSLKTIKSQGIRRSLK